MTVKVNISRYFFGGWTTESVAAEVSGKTVGRCLDDLVKEFPDIKKSLFEDDGSVAVEARLFVNGESAFPNETARPVRDGDIIDILPMTISGG